MGTNRWNNRTTKWENIKNRTDSNRFKNRGVIFYVDEDILV